MSTVKLTYTGAKPVAVPDARLTVEPGQTVELDADIAASLVRQGDAWKPAKRAEPKEA